jgi:hypothetical protein
MSDSPVTFVGRWNWPTFNHLRATLILFDIVASREGLGAQLEGSVIVEVLMAPLWKIVLLTPKSVRATRTAARFPEYIALRNAPGNIAGTPFFKRTVDFPFPRGAPANHFNKAR